MRIVWCTSPAVAAAVLTGQAGDAGTIAQDGIVLGLMDRQRVQFFGGLGQAEIEKQARSKPVDGRSDCFHHPYFGTLPSKDRFRKRPVPCPSPTPICRPFTT